MAISPNINDRQKNSILENPRGDAARRVKQEGGWESDYYTLRDESALNVVFVGEATTQEEDTSSAVWRIRRILTTSSGTITSFATNSGNESDVAFDQIWDDRTSLFPAPPYSNDFSTLFDTNSFALIGDVPELDFDGLGPCTLTSWSRATGATQKVITSKQGAINAAGYRVAIQSGNPRFHLSGGSSSDRIEVRSGDFTTLNDGAWYFVAFVYDGTQNASGVDIYVGEVGVDLLPVLDTSTILTADTLVSSASNTVDAQISGRNGTTNIFSGNLDEIALYNTDLSFANLTAIYNIGVPRDLSTLPTYANNIGWWRMGEGRDGFNIPDEKNGNTAVYTNGIEDDFVTDTPS